MSTELPTSGWFPVVRNVDAAGHLPIVRLWTCCAPMLAVTAIAGCTSAAVQPGGPSRATSGQASRSGPISRGIGWVHECMASKASERLGPARAYVALSTAAASRLADRRGENLVFVGTAGTCSGVSDDVLRGHVVAIALDTRHGAATVVAAERVSGYWSVGT